MPPAAPRVRQGGLLWWYAALGGARLALKQLIRSPGQLLTLVTSPLFALMFLSIAVRSGDHDLVVSAVFAPALISLWLLAVGLCGGLISGDRWTGTLELALVAPAPLLLSVIGRICATFVLAALSMVESALVARIGFGVRLTLHHPVLLALTLAATLLAMVGTASLFSAAFVLSRVALLFQNAMTYPFYILGGILVPVGLLPHWLRPLSALVFLSWSGDLLRDCFGDSGHVHDWPLRLAAITALALAALAAGAVLMARISGRVARTGSATLA
jgi:ABC-2 type transport system permease protein